MGLKTFLHKFWKGSLKAQKFLLVPDEKQIIVSTLIRTAYKPSSYKYIFNMKTEPIEIS